MKIFRAYVQKKRQVDMDYWCKSQSINLVPTLSSYRYVRHFTLGCPGQKPLEIMLRENEPNVTWREMTMKALEIRRTFSGHAHMGSHGVPFGSWLDREIASWPAVPSLMASREKANPTFRFFDLPGELRNEIYKEVTGHYVWRHECRSPVSRPGTQSWVRVFDIDRTARRETHFTKQFCLDPSGLRPPSAMALPLVSKLVNSEFEQVFWEHTFKHFEGPLTLQNMIPLMQETIAYQSLQRISLGFSNELYLSLAGLYVTSSGALASNRVKALGALQNIPTLRHIHFHFQTSPPFPKKSIWQFVNSDP
jgi:hypothetical protein